MLLMLFPEQLTAVGRSDYPRSLFAESITSLRRRITFQFGRQPRLIQEAGERRTGILFPQSD